ncbi:hypothetical protein [Streptomyces sp. 4F14]|uniref:hypothetical protein n=1 Tax=Streptomyces sp. 4F14 TaxID=3394380 RepID=UPI003A83D875
MTHMPAHPVGGIAVLPIPGSAAAGVAIAPIATNFGGEVVNTFIGREICKAVDGAEAKLGEKVQIASREFCNKDMRDIGQSGESYFPHCRPADQKADLSQMKEGIKRTYVATGSAENQYRGQDPYKE